MQLFEYVRVKYAVYTNNCLQVDTVGFQHPLLRIGARSYVTIWFDGHPVLFCQETRLIKLTEVSIVFSNYRRKISSSIVSKPSSSLSPPPS
jgi:hypothetical protein